MSSMPLAQKLKLRPGITGALIHPPEGYLIALAPERVTLDNALIGQYDWIQVFVASKAELDALFPAMFQSLSPNGILWISFPKGSSRQQTDLTRNKGWQAVKGLKWINLVAIDENWSAFSMRHFKPGEDHTSFR